MTDKLLFTVKNQFHSGKHNQQKCRDKSRRAADLSFGCAKTKVLALTMPEIEPQWDGDDAKEHHEPAW